MTTSMRRRTRRRAASTRERAAERAMVVRVAADAQPRRPVVGERAVHGRLQIIVCALPDAVEPLEQLVGGRGEELLLGQRVDARREFFPVLHWIFLFEAEPEGRPR